MSEGRDEDRQRSQPTPASGLSSREWLDRVRVTAPLPERSVPRPPSPRFTWGWRAGIVFGFLFYGVLGAWSWTPDGDTLRALRVVVLAVALLVAVAAAVEAWCWAGRQRFPADAAAITAGLPPETKKTVKRMAAGRGTDVPELRPYAAAYAWAQQQGTGIGPLFLALINVGTLAQNAVGSVGFVLGLVVLLMALAGLGWQLWLGHRARALAAHLPLRP